MRTPPVQPIISLVSLHAVQEGANTAFDEGAPCGACFAPVPPVVTATDSIHVTPIVESPYSAPLAVSGFHGRPDASKTSQVSSTVSWSWCDASGIFIEYEEAVCQHIETMYATGHADVLVHCGFPEQAYTINFSEMRQAHRSQDGAVTHTKVKR